MIPMTTTSTGEHRCMRCGRRLRTAKSIAAGYGAGCRARIRAAAKLADLAAWTGRQLEQARELIEDGGIVPTARPGVFRTVSTDGSTVYLTSARWCGCPARAECYHRAGVLMVLAA